MNDAPPQLLLSALTWTGRPTIWCAGDEDRHIGSYAHAFTVQLNKFGINTRLKAVEYTPATPAVCQYQRYAHVGTWPDPEDSAVFGTNMPPVVRICPPGRSLWPDRFKRSSLDDYVERPCTGPPFQFYNIDWTGESELYPHMHGIRLSPDLPGQPEDDRPSVGDDPESESAVGLGWKGPWATALLDRQDQDQPLGERVAIVWDTGKQLMRQTSWGVKVRFQAIHVTEANPDIYEEVEDSVPSRGISSYKVRATILRVFVKNTFVEQNNSVESSEDEGEGMDRENEDDGEEHDDESEYDEGMDSEYEYA